MDRTLYAFFARGTEQASDYGLNIASAFFSTFAPKTLPCFEQWLVVGECSWLPGENAVAHTVDVQLVAPEGVEPIQYTTVPAHQEPWTLPPLADGTISPLFS